MIPVPRVALATLDTEVLVFALIAEPAAAGAVEERTSPGTTVLERVDLGPFICWNPSIPSGFCLDLRLRLAFSGRALQGTELFFEALPPLLVLASLGCRLGRRTRAGTRALPIPHRSGWL